MKRLVLGLGLLGIALGSASGCDDNRPVVGIAPDGVAGEMSLGGDQAAGGAGSAHASAGSPNQGGDISGGGATPSSSGADTGGASLAGQNEGGQAMHSGGAAG